MGRATPTACYRELGEELRKRREDAGLTGVELAQRMGYPPMTVSRMEHAGRHSTPIDVITYLGFLGIFGPAARDLVELCREAQRNVGFWLSPHGQWLPDSLNSLIYHESTADRSTTYEPQMVPGLLQTADYARAWIARERWRRTEDVEECVQIRMERQQILDSRRPALTTFFIQEQALLLRVGVAAIMHEQLLKILLLTTLDHVNVHVVPAHTAFGGPFRLFEYEQHQPLVYLDSYSTGLFLEEREYVEPYRTLIPTIAEVALDGEQSREFVATLASDYDRGSEQDADGVEEEQL